MILLAETKFGRSGRARSYDQHAISITVEAIPVTDGFLVRAKNEFASGKRAYQHQQSRAGQVEIRQKTINNSKREWRMDEQTGLAGLRFNLSVKQLGADHCCFEHPRSEE